MDFDRFLEWMGNAIATALLVVGIVLFVSGFRFINSLDTIFRFVAGGCFTIGCGLYFYRQWRRRRRARAIVARLNW